MDFEPLFDRYQAFLLELSEACQALKIDPPEVVLASKTQPAEALRALYSRFGVVDFGENYLQEAEEKMRALSELPLRYHFIGAIQTRKCKWIASFFEVVHSLCRQEEARLLSQSRVSGRPLEVYLQVNISNAPQKNGLPPHPQAILELSALVESLPHLKLSGLMVLPEPGDSGAFERAQSLLLKTFPRRPELKLSMGMSEDWKEALKFGSRCIRVGSRVFGARG